jgi:hypothetical protein
MGYAFAQAPASPFSLNQIVLEHSDCSHQIESKAQRMSEFSSEQEDRRGPD